jgi:hypothetical protein
VLPAGLEPLPPLGMGPPAGWANAGNDPGWELDNVPEGEPIPPTPSIFDETMSRQRERPAFQPRPPQPHPQARSLRGDPFGGLTFEPPGGPPDDDDKGSR